MFVSDRGQHRARTAALVIATAAAIQLWPNAQADPVGKIAAAETSETKIVKKASKKKRSSSHVAATITQGSPWKLMPAVAIAAEADQSPKKKRNPIKVVLKVAHKQIGKPYRWGATGPSSFDCSGFTSYVWRKAGVEIPRTSSSQYAGLAHVSKKKARPGDLVFAPGHVGLYLGKGKMIHSPHSGRTVEISPIHDGTYGFARPKP